MERESARARDALRLGQKIGGQMGGGRGDWDSVIFPRDILYWRRGGRGGGNGSNVDAILLPHQRWAAMWCHGGMTLALSGWTTVLLTLVLLLCWCSAFPIAN